MGQYHRKLSKGVKWLFRGSYLGRKYCSQCIYLSKKEAKAAEREYLERLDEEIRHPKKDMSLWDLCNHRLDHLRARKSNDYYKENKRYFQKILDEWGKETPASSITRAMANQLLLKEAERLKKKGRDNYKVNAMLRSLKALWNWGNRIYELNIKNPFEGLEFHSVNIRLKYIPTEDEMSAVYVKLNDKQKLLFDFIKETGARIMEAVRFFNDPQIDGELITLWTRKAKNSNLTPRRIPKPLCLDRDYEALKGEWTAYPRFLEDLTKGKWNFHNLRHRIASIWATDGMTTFELMTRLGHSNLQTTMRYLRLLGFTRQ